MLSGKIKSILKEAQLLYYLGDYDGVRTLLNPFKGEDTSEQLDADHVAIELAIGNTYLMEANYILAAKYYSIALKMAEKIGNPFCILKSKFSIASVLFNQKDFYNAIEYLNTIIIEATQKKYRDIEACAKGLKGEIKCIERNLSESLKLHQESLKLFLEIKTDYGIADQLSNLGRVYFNLNNFDLAEKYFQKSFDLFSRIGDKNQIAIQINNLAAIDASLCQFEKAIDMFKEALKIREEIGNYSGMANIQENIAHIYHFSLMNHFNAIHWYKKSVESHELTRRRIAGTFRQQEAYFAEFFEVYQKLIDLLYEKYSVGHNQEVFNEIFRYSERAKAFALLTKIENIDGVKLDNKLDDSELNSIKELHQEINQLFSDFQYIYLKDKEKAKNILIKKKEKERILSELELEGILRKKGFNELQLPNTPSIDFLQKDVLKDDKVILSYYVTLFNVYCLEITSSLCKIHLLGKVETLNRYVTQYLNGFADDSFRDQEIFILKNYDLWRFLTLDGLLFAEKTKTFLISPDEKINNIAFESLPLTKNSKNPSYLGLDHQILYYPSASTIVSMHLKAIEKNEVNYDLELVAFVNPLNSYFEAIPDAEIQGKRIKQLLNGNDDDLFIQSNASKEKFKQKLEKSIRCLHIGSHAILDSNEINNLKGLSLLEPAIIFSNKNCHADFLLTASEISEMIINAKIVTLSACVTGAGKIIRGEGANSLARAFIAAGAQCVVASLWPIWSHLSRDFIIIFYEKIKSKSISEAFFEAKKSIAIKYPKPLDWASFIIIGNSQQRLK